MFLPEDQEEVYFRFAELPEGVTGKSLKLGTELEFSLVPDSYSQRPVAIALSLLPEGTVKLEVRQRTIDIDKRITNN